MMEKRGVISPGLTPPENKIKQASVQGDSEPHSSEQEVRQLEDHTSKRLADVVEEAANKNRPK